MRLLRAWVTLVWLSFHRLLWSSGTLMIMFPLLACAVLVVRQRHRYLRSLDELGAFDMFSDFFAIKIFAVFIVPIIALAYATSSIGGDREDRTLLFLLIRPVPRSLVLLAKVAATLPLVLGITVGSFFIFCTLADGQFRGDLGWPAFQSYAAPIFYMGLAYTCLFHLFAVMFRHSTIVALVYSLFMEFIIGNLPGIIKRLAVNYYGRSMMYRMGEAQGLLSPPKHIFEPIPAGFAEAALLWIAGITLLAALVVFQRREYHDLT